MIPTSLARTLLPAAVVLIAAACDPTRSEEGAQDHPAQTESDEFRRAVTWGCVNAIASKVENLNPRWREEVATLVGDFGLGVTNFRDSAWRPHKDADLQFKLPVMIEGHSGATVWIPRHDRDRVALILSDTPRRGLGNSYRVEEGHQWVRFEPCADKNWTAWIAALALADRKESVLNVKVDGVPQPTSVTLGPWRCPSTAISPAPCMTPDLRP